jgi:hypothetical protein
MWPQPHVRGENLNPYPFFPFDQRWGDSLPDSDFETFCLLLRLAWVAARPCFLPANVEDLNRMLQCYRTDMIGTVNDRILAHFTVHPSTGLMYFPPQMKALHRLVEGENMYALLWEERS